MAGRTMAAAGRTGRQPNAASPAVTVHVPMRFQTRGGRKAVMAAQGQDGPVTRPSTAPRPDPLLAALARAFYWRKLIDTGACASIAEIAAAERVSAAYVSRLMRLTLLKPQIVLTICEERRSGSRDTLCLDDLAQPLSVAWERQVHALRDLAEVRTHPKRQADRGAWRSRRLGSVM